MTPDELLSQLKAGKVAPAYLFLGPDAWRRDECRKMLVQTALPEEDREQGYTRLDLDEVSLTDALDDACSYSLFASTRLIWVSSAEGALPRGDATEPPEGLVRFLKDPPPGVTLVLQCSRYDFDGDDKAKLERVQKHFAAVPSVAVSRNLTPPPAEVEKLIVMEFPLNLNGFVMSLTSAAPARADEKPSSRRLYRCTCDVGWA